MRITIYIIFLFLFVSNCFAQKPWENTYLKGKMHYGFLLPHHKSIEYDVEKHISSFEINLFKQTFGQGMYEKLYRYPRFGVGYFYSGLSNPVVYGQAHGIFSYMNIPVTRFFERWQLNYRIAIGMAYLNKRFDIDNNIKNTTIGTHTNIHFNFTLNTNYTITDGVEFVNAIGLTHFSNGNIHKPNLGLNLITLSAGMNYRLVSPKEKSITAKDHYDQPKKKYAFALIYSAGFRTYDFTINKKYFASSLSINAGYNFNHKRKTGLGLDLFYSGALEPAIKKRQDAEADFYDLWQAGIHGFHDLTYKNLILTMQLGYYFYAVYKEAPVYTRIGLNYKINQHILTNISLKTHYAVADFVEWGIGYCW